MYNVYWKTEKMVSHTASSDGYIGLVVAIILIAIDDYAKAKAKKKWLEEHYVDAINDIMKKSRLEKRRLSSVEAEKEYDFKIRKCESIMEDAIRFFESDYYESLCDIPAQRMIDRCEEAYMEEVQKKGKRRQSPIGFSLFWF